MFQKKINLAELDDMIFHLDDHNFKTENVAEKAETVLLPYEYSRSMKKKLATELTTTFKAFNVPHAALKQELRNEIEKSIYGPSCGEGYPQHRITFMYLCLMMLSHTNFPGLIAALAQYKRTNAFFTPAIFIKTLPVEAKTKAPSTIYDTVNQFLEQMAHFDLLIKIDQLYKVAKYEADGYDQYYGPMVIKALPEQYHKDLMEIFEIEEEQQTSPEAVQD